MTTSGKIKPRKPHLLSVPGEIYDGLERRGKATGQTPGELARQVFNCWMKGIPLPEYGLGPRLVTVEPASPTLTAALAERTNELAARDHATHVALAKSEAAAREHHDKQPAPNGFGRATFDDEMHVEYTPPAPVNSGTLDPIAPATWGVWSTQPAQASGPRPDIDFDNPNDEVLRNAQALLDRSKDGGGSL